jgi:protein-disulfide isomerase
VSSSGGRLAIPVSDDDHALGPQSASITLVEYGDYECPYCGKAYPIVAALQRIFGDELRFVFRNMPLSNVNPHAVMAAEAAEAAGLQGHFWEMHDLLLEHQTALEPSALLSYATASGADATVLETVLERRATRDRVEHDVEGGLRSGVTATPTFFVNEARYDGSWELEPFAQYLASVVRARSRDNRLIDEAGRESFPASDPPAF